MALRFHCEHCGKRLQADVARGDAVSCPFCRRQLTVPTHATENTPGPASAETGSSHDEVREEGLVAAAARVIPGWGSSVVFHLAILLVALTATWSTMKADVPVEYNARVEQKATPNPKYEHRPSRSTHESREKRKRTDFAYKEKATNKPYDFEAFNEKQIELIGVRDDQGGAGPGGIPNFGPGPRGPDDSFFTGCNGVNGSTNKIVYIIDRSGSMTDSIWFVKSELRRSIRSLRFSQEFHVIFYSTGPALELPAGKLVPAVPANRDAAFEFIDNIVPRGGTDPRDAIKAALRLKPDVIHLLSDGEFDEPQKTVQLIDQLNTGRKVKVRINTYCYLYEPPNLVMQTIANRSGGTYKFVGEEAMYEDRNR
jgi:von Willebrand factor type A domain